MSLLLEDMEHLAVRVRHGPGREEYLADRSRALRVDAQERIGMLILSPSVAARVDDVEGRVVENDGKRYRVIVDQYLAGARDKDGSEVAGYWLEPWSSPPPMNSLAVDWALNETFRLEPSR